MNAPALFASPTPDSSDRFKTLKTDSILPCIWPSLNPLTNYRLAEQVSVQRGAIPIQILPYSLVLSHISLSSAFFWPFSSSPLSVQPFPLSPFLTLSHSYTKKITILSQMCFFSLSFCQCPCSVCLFFYFLLSTNALVPPPPPVSLSLSHISLSSMSALLTLSLRHYPHLFTSLIASFFPSFILFSDPLLPHPPFSQAVCDCNVAEENTVCQPESDR